MKFFPDPIPTTPLMILRASPIAISVRRHPVTLSRCHPVPALRRGDLSAERLLLEQNRLALLESASQEQREKLFWEWVARPEVQAKLYPQRDRDDVRREVERMLND